MGRLDGQRALVTGAGSGIGSAIAVALAAEGALLTLVGRDAGRLERRAAALGGVATAACDVTDEAAVERLAASAGPVDLLVNNAGAAESAPLARTDLALWRRPIVPKRLQLCNRGDRNNGRASEAPSEQIAHG